MTGILAILFIATTTFAWAPDARAATTRVVIVVGPVGSQTSSYRDSARALASLARGYGAAVTEIYSPYATWSRVSAAARGANVLVYLGHGNGWPSPYYPFSTATKDGMGLNSSSGAGNSNVKYYGELYMARLGLAPNAVVLLHRLCYAAGASEPGWADPTRSVAMKRVDNFGAGFLRGGAQAVFASGKTSIGYVLRGLFGGAARLTMGELFWTDPSRTMTYRITFTSTRTAGASARMDPSAPSKYYRSVVGYLGRTVGDWRSGTVATPNPTPTPVPSVTPAPTPPPSATPDPGQVPTAAPVESPVATPAPSG